MNLLEYQGKALFREYGIATPRHEVAFDTPGLVEAFSRFEEKAVLKIQVTAGGRGKAGGVKVAGSAAEAREFADYWLGREFKGTAVSAFLAEEALVIQDEMYMSVALNPRRGTMLFLFCKQGGVDIEQIAAESPDSLLRVELQPGVEYREFYFRKLLTGQGFTGDILVKLARTAQRLVNCFIKSDLVLAEINPLVILADGTVLAADAKVEADDGALFRQGALRAIREKTSAADKLEEEAAQIGVTYIRLDGDIGIIASGAGLSMNTMDLVTDIGCSPANFLETGGGITSELMRRSLHLVVKHEPVRAVVVNLYGGVNPLLEAAKGLAEGARELVRPVPLVVKALGNQQEECWRILEESGIPVIKSHRTEDAVAHIKQALGVNN